MKTLLSLLCLCLVVTSAARAELSAAGWLETYYLNPQPSELPRQIRQLSHDGYFERPGHVALAIGFIGTIFAAHPQEVDGWLLQLNGLPLRHQKLIAAALWQAGHPLGAELLPLLGQFDRNHEQLAEMASEPCPSILATPVRSPSSLNLHWGAFLATGDERHILTILDALGSERPGLGGATQRALTQKAASHPRVLAICRDQLEKQPEEIRNPLRAAIYAVATAPHS
jgi:hypothetical protein